MADKITKAEFNKFLDSFDREPGEYTDQEMYEIGMKYKLLPTSEKRWGDLSSILGAKDKDGNNLNVPIDKWNHALDALRYAIYTHFAKEYNYGNYNFSIR